MDDDASIAGAHGPRRLDEVLLSQEKKLPTHQPSKAGLTQATNDERQKSDSTITAPTIRFRRLVPTMGMIGRRAWRSAC